MVVKSLDDDSSDEKLNGIPKVSYVLGVKRFAIGVMWLVASRLMIDTRILEYCQILEFCIV